ncbi:hypothetical protein ABZX77_16810 [Streptomyces sp. NPDC004237]|uniref:hypothetical protein n=1 Tax=Streptomyces sp. NPDC004237 TaxID=3154455 RepID=UPI0033A7A75C
MSSEHPGKEDDWADLLYWTDGSVYVWDVKHGGGEAERKDGKEVMDKAGFDIPPQAGINNFKKNKGGDRLQNQGDQTNHVARAASPRAGAGAGERGFVVGQTQNWWHENITNHDWFNNPWTPKSPVGGGFPMPLPTIP